jgi:hypothetical protein
MLSISYKYNVSNQLINSNHAGATDPVRGGIVAFTRCYLQGVSHALVIHELIIALKL